MQWGCREASACEPGNVTRDALFFGASAQAMAWELLFGARVPSLQAQGLVRGVTQLQ